MQAFTVETYKPKYQRAKKPEVEFQLQQLDQRTLYQMQIDMVGGRPGPDGAFAVFDHAVIGWSGYEVEFSREAKRELMRGVGKIDWTIWMAEIAAHLYKRSVLGDDAAKNS